ncbi:MAG: uL15m family ribosomal protein [Nanoarchaeota archaeon]
MVVKKRKKVGRYRGKGSGTHGGGARKKRRGAGSRGGRGRAGSGKRAGHKKYGIVLGSRGFTSKSTTPASKALNVGTFTDNFVHKWMDAGKITKEGQFYLVDLAKLGYTKLLGTGNTSFKLKIKVSSCSPQAAEKIEAAGGEIILAAKKSSEDSVEDKTKVKE